MKTITLNREFKVALISGNTNSFGLYGVIIIDRNGQAWEVATNSLNLPAKESIITIKETFNQETGESLGLNFAEKGFEIPRRLPNATSDVLEVLFAKGASLSNQLGSIYRTR
jgi:hypothetical protein